MKACIYLVNQSILVLGDAAWVRVKNNMIPGNYSTINVVRETKHWRGAQFQNETSCRHEASLSCLFKKPKVWLPITDCEK